MRILTVVLAALLAVPAAPDLLETWRFSRPAFADDDGRGGFRVPRFRAVRPPQLPRLPVYRVPQLPRPPRAATPPPRAASPARPQPPPAVAADVVPGEVVVGPVAADTLALILADNFTLVASAPVDLLGGVVARLRPPPGLDLDAARARVLQIAPAATVEANHLYRPVEIACRDGDCPAFAMVGWAVPPDRCAAAVTLGMIDTTVNREHDGLRRQAIEIVPMLSEGDRASSAVHGTAVAALLVGDEKSRTPGLLPDASLVVVEAFHRDAGGDAADAYKVVRGIDALAQRDIRVANLSFAGPPNQLLQRAIEAARARDMILVAAAGNRGPQADPLYPAAYPGVIAVTAVDRDLAVYRQAGRGAHIAFAAPGVGLWTAASVSGGRYRSGTSYAVPFVSAAFAAALAARPAAASADLIDGLAARSADLGDAGRDPVFGWGLIKAPPCLPAEAGPEPERR